VPPEPAAGRRLRIGVVGAGWASTEHAATLAASGRADVVAVADLDAGLAHRLASAHGAVAFAGAEELIDSVAGLDAVLVGTPTAAHRVPVCLALERGIPAFVEKPIARTAEDAAAIVQAAARAGVPCAVGYQWRAVAALTELDDATSDTVPGLLVSRGIGATQARAWFYDGALIGERASHHIDLQRRVAGEVVSVQAVFGQTDTSGAGGTNAGGSVVSLTLSFASGALGTIDVVWLADGGPNRQDLTVVTPERILELDLDPSFALRGRPRRADPAPTAPEHPFRRQLLRFLDAVEARDPGLVACSAEAAAGTLDVVLAATRAASERSAVATTPRRREPGDHASPRKDDR
jgi:predicted dehydrogenase